MFTHALSRVQTSTATVQIHRPLTVPGIHQEVFDLRGGTVIPTACLTLKETQRVRR